MPAVNEPIRAPGFREGQWLNASPLQLADLRGRVVLVDFWDYACVNCLRTLPYVQAWWRRYRELGLTVVGVHTPEFAFGRDNGLVVQAALELGIEYPVLLDRDRHTWGVWMNRFWPTKYLLDQEGLIRFFHFGEGEYLGLEAQLQILLRAATPTVALPPLLLPLRPSDEPGVLCYHTTPDVYLGYNRGRLGSTEGHHPDRVVTYRIPTAYAPDEVYLGGAWEAAAEAMVLDGPEGVLQIYYRAKEVYLVLSPPPDGPGEIVIEQDEAPLLQEAFGAHVLRDGRASIVRVDRPRAYQLVANPHFGTHVLRLTFRTPGLAAYVFNFTSEVMEEAMGEAA
jgi:thiol-disulfide isomerase/thioredoxin